MILLPPSSVPLPNPLLPQRAACPPGPAHPQFSTAASPGGRQQPCSPSPGSSSLLPRARSSPDGLRGRRAPRSYRTLLLLGGSATSREPVFDASNSVPSVAPLLELGSPAVLDVCLPQTSCCSCLLPQSVGLPGTRHACPWEPCSPTHTCQQPPSCVITSRTAWPLHPHCHPPLFPRFLQQPLSCLLCLWRSRPSVPRSHPATRALFLEHLCGGQCSPS